MYKTCIQRKEIEQENERGIEKIIQGNIKEWTSDLSRWPPVSRENLYHLVEYQ